jgi:hypothetical protein
MAYFVRLARRCALALAVFAVAAPAAGAGTFFVGVDEDAVKWGDGAAAAPLLRSLGVQAVRVTLPWQPGQTQVAAGDQQAIERVVFGTGLRVVVSVYGAADAAPRTEEARAQYCDYVADLLTRNPSVSDVVIWNDPNDGAFWSPQFNPDGSSVAPFEYEALLATCWSKLHALRAGINVVAASASKGGVLPDAHDTVTWYRKLGEAYRASGRREPIFDTVGQVPHVGNASQRPWVRHSSATVGEGDYARLVAALTAGFGGTAQPLPGFGGVTIWYLAQGFQTSLDPAKARLYSGTETERGLVVPWSPAAAKDTRKGPAPDQATQLVDALRVAFCQPTVGAFFNFHVADEAGLAGWQSGLLWADWTPKPSLGAFRRAVADVNGRRIKCSAFTKGIPPRPVQVAATVPLKVTDLHATRVSALSAVLSWKTTVPARVSVSYGFAESGPTVWGEAHGSGLVHDGTLLGLASTTTYRAWVTATTDDGQQAEASVDVRTSGPPRSPDSSVGGGNVLVDGQPFFPLVVWAQCPFGYAADLAAGINLFADNPCGGLSAQLDGLGGRALSAAVAGKDATGNGPGLLGYFLPDEPDGLGMTADQLPPKPTGAAGQVGFLTLTNHFYSGAAPLAWGRGMYPGLIARSDVVGFDLYPLQEWCRPERMADVFYAQQELVNLAAPRPTFQWIEAADMKCPGGATEITPATVKAESWLAIAGGARGLGFFPADFTPSVAVAVKDVGRQVAKLGPSLMAPSIPADSDNPLVKVGARVYANAVYVIAVNAGFTPLDATVRVPGLAGRTLRVLDEGREVGSGDGSFKDSFAPLGVHVYVAAPPQG